MQIADPGHFPRRRKLSGVDLSLDGHDVPGHVHLAVERRDQAGGEQEDEAERQPPIRAGGYPFAQIHGAILAPGCNKHLTFVNSFNE